MHLANLEDTDHTVKTFVLEQSLLNQVELKLLESEAAEILHERESKAEAVLYQVDLARRVLVISRYLDGELLEEIDLSPETGAHVPSVPATELWAQQVMLVDSSDGRMIREHASSELTGLLVTSKNCYLWSADFEQQQRVISSQTWLDPRRLKHHGQSGPYDLHVSARHRFVFVTDRAAGKLIVVSGDSHAVVARLEIRAAGSHKAIHLAIDEANDKVYITDNETSNFKILSLRSFRLHNYQLGLGVLGNLLLSADGRSLYLLTLKPRVSFKSLDADSLEVLKELNLRGKLISKERDLPLDALFMTPDKAHVLLMSYRDEVQPWAPLINVLETRENRPVLFYSLPAGETPCLMACDRLNPFYLVAPDLEQLMLQREILTQEQLQQMHAAPQALETGVEVQDKQHHSLLAIPTPTGKRQVPRIKLPKEAEDKIQDMVRSTFYRHTGIHLRDHRIEMNKLAELAFNIRTDLEQGNLAEVRKSNFFFNHFSLRLDIYRDSLLSYLEYHKEAEQRAKLTPPYRCPRCSVSTLGRWICPSCHFQMIRPEWLNRAELVSCESDTHAVPGEVLVPNGQKVLLLNPAQACLWEYDLGKLDLQTASDVRILPNKHLLVSDAQSGRVAELSELGDVIWEVTGVPLSRPVQATMYRQYGTERFLIADPGLKQVIELNRAQEPLWKYGGPDQDLLTEPVSVQRTHRQTYLIVDRAKARVIEVNEQGKVIKEHGRNLSLRQPVYARLGLDEQILIVDSGAHLIYLLENEFQVSFHFDFQPPDLPAEMLLGPISWTTQTVNGQVLLSDGNSLMAVDPVEGQIQWFVSLDKIPVSQEVIADSNALFFAPNPLDQRAVFLSEQSIYKEISPDAVMLLAKAMSPTTFRAGDKIVVEGDNGASMFTILQGTVQVFKSGSADPVASLHSGDTFGEMALYLLEERSATVIAKTDCYLLRLDHGPFRKAMEEYPELNKRFKELCLKRKRVLHQRKVGRYQEAVEDLKARMAVSRMRKLNLFQSLSPAVFDALKERLYSVSYPRKHFVFRHKDPVRQLYFISRGSLDVLGENDRLINTLNEGEVFGEIALMLDRPRTASVRTKGYCELYQLDREVLYQALQAYPELRRQLQQIAEERFERDAGIVQPSELVDTAVESQLITRIEGVPSPGQPLIFCANQNARQVVGVHSSGQIVWVFGGSQAQQVLNPCWISGNEHSVLITDAGHNRILEVDRQTRVIVGEYGDDEFELYQPASATFTGKSTLLICDQGSESIYEVSQGPQSRITWTLDDPEGVVSPRYAELTSQDTVLYADDELHQVIEVNRQKQAIWSYGEALFAGDDVGQLKGPTFATRLENGHTLIADTGNQRVLEVNAEQEIVWFYDGSPDHPLVHPESARRLANGNTLIVSNGQSEIIEITPLRKRVWYCQLLPPAEAASI